VLNVFIVALALTSFLLNSATGQISWYNQPLIYISKSQCLAEVF